MWTEVAAAPAAIHVGTLDAYAGAGEVTESGGEDDVERGGKVVLGATVKTAVVDDG
jgi:hypothetical protein